MGIFGNLLKKKTPLREKLGASINNNAGFSPLTVSRPPAAPSGFQNLGAIGPGGLLIGQEVKPESMVGNVLGGGSGESFSNVLARRAGGISSQLGTPQAPQAPAVPAGATKIVNPATGGTTETQVKDATATIPPATPFTQPFTAPPTTGGIPGATIPPPPPVPETSAVDIARADVARKMALSPEEIKAQEDIDKLAESTRSAFVGAGEQAIPLEFITGKQASIEKRGLILGQTIRDRAALAEAKRKGALEISKFKLGEEKEKIAAAEPEAGFTLGAGQKRFTAEGAEIAGVAKPGEAGISTATVNAWTDLIKSGDAKMSDIPSDIRGKVAQSLSASPLISQKSKDAITQANNVIATIDEIIPGINSLTAGLAGSATRFIPGTPSFDLASKIDTIKANVGFQALQAMRNASPTGGALGQVSEMENRLLQATIASLDPSQSPDQLKANLEKVKTHFNNLISILNEAQNQGGEGGGNIVQTSVGPVNTSF